MVIKKILITYFLCSMIVITYGQSVPGTLSYQGILLTNDGITPLEGAQNLEFTFHNAVTGGSQLSVAARTITVTATKGLFTCIIGDGSTGNAPFSVAEIATLAAQPSFIQLKVGTTVLSPRAQVTPSVYAFQAQSAYSISDNAVTNAKIADNAVGTAEIVNGAVTDSKLASVVGSANTANAIVKRDASGNFSAGTITANLNGNVTGNVTGNIIGNATTVTTNANLTGDVTSVGNITSITSGIIVNTDVNTNAAIDGTKVNPNFGSQNIVTTGNLGIGTTNPSYPLHVTTTGARAGYFQNNSTSGTSYGVRTEATGLSTGTNYGVYASASGGATNYAGYFAGDVNIGGNLYLNGPWSILDASSTSATPTRTAALDIICPTSYTYLYQTTCGSVTCFASASGTYTSYVRPGTDNETYLGSASRRWITVYATNGTINTSDYRLKDEIQNINYGLNEVLKLRPVSFKWKESNAMNKQNLGFLAQEVERITPEVVEIPKNEKEYYGMNYSQLIPVLVKAIQEQQSQIEDLKSKNSELEKRLAAIEAMLSKGNVTSTAASTKTEK